MVFIIPQGGFPCSNVSIIRECECTNGTYGSYYAHGDDYNIKNSPSTILGMHLFIINKVTSIISLLVINVFGSSKVNIVIDKDMK